MSKYLKFKATNTSEEVDLIIGLENLISVIANGTVSIDMYYGKAAGNSDILRLYYNASNLTPPNQMRNFFQNAIIGALNSNATAPVSTVNPPLVITDYANI